MTKTPMQQEKCLYLIAAIILLIGLGNSILMYLAGSHDLGNALGYMIIDGGTYPGMPEDSKMYRHVLQVYGCKFSFLADQLMCWFSGL